MSTEPLVHNLWVETWQRTKFTQLKWVVQDKTGNKTNHQNSSSIESIRIYERWKIKKIKSQI